MKPQIFILSITISIILVVNAFSADWVYYGGNKNAVLFYDSTSVNKSKKKVRFWTKSMSVDEIRNLSEEEVIDNNDKAILKLKNGYIPPFTRVSPGKHDIVIAGLEQLANDISKNVKSKELAEIDCYGKMIKVLSMTLFNEDGSVETTTSKPTDWRYIEPESNLESLEKILCRHK